MQSQRASYLEDAVYVYNSPLPDTLSSVRMMAILPARHLGVRVLYFGSGLDPDSFLDQHAPKVLILTKVQDASFVDLARAASKRNVKIVAIFCDFHFDDELGKLNREISQLADIIVAQTTFMASELAQQFGKKSVLIEEAIEYPRRPPRFAPHSTLKMAWYGHSSNYDALGVGLNQFSEASIGPIDLTVVSNVAPTLADLNLKEAPKQISVTFCPWSLITQFTVMNASDLIFVPSLDTPDKRVKGHNRVVEAINAGLPAITFPLPQYLELASYSWCDSDYVKSLRDLIQSPASTIDRIKRGQDYIDGRFSIDVLLGKWRALILNLAG